MVSVYAVHPLTLVNQEQPIFLLFWLFLPISYFISASSEELLRPPSLVLLLCLYFSHSWLLYALQGAEFEVWSQGKDSKIGR